MNSPYHDMNGVEVLFDSAIRPCYSVFATMHRAGTQAA